MSTYKLIKTEINKKAAKYNYKVVDESGAVISERNSNKEYIACTIDGSFFFGRLDLIGKGYHGRFMREWQKKELFEIAYL